MLVYPYFGNIELPFIRLGGPGLGNLLFPYCRAFIYAQQYGMHLIPPIWPSFKPGPIIRNEKDARFYFNLFEAQNLQRFRLLFKTRHHPVICEDDFLKNPQSDAGTSCILKVRGLRNYFSDLQNFEAKLFAHLLAISHRKVKLKLSRFNTQSIGLHVRMGDAGAESRLAADWYMEKIQAARKLEACRNLPVFIFSDAADGELKPLLRLQNVYRIDQPDALSDLLRLSKCKLIIGSHSTFSAWAAFLSRSPFIRPDDFYLKRLRANTELFEGSIIPQEMQA